MKVLAIDFGGTHVTCGLVEDRVLLAHETIDTDCAKSLQAVLPRIRDVCLELMQAPSSRDVAGVAIGFAALVDSRVNRILSTDGKYEDVKDIDLAKWVRENIGLPTRIENDARMALLGESYAGAALGFTDVVMMTLGTGIGGVAMIEGKLLRGKHAQAGCLGGHIPAVFNGRPCTRRRPPQEVPKVKSRPQAAGKRHDSHQRVTTRAGSASGPDKFNEATILQLQARMAAGTLSSVATLLAPQAPDSLPSTHSRIRQVCRILVASCRIRRIRQVLTTKLGWE